MSRPSTSRASSRADTPFPVWAKVLVAINAANGIAMWLLVVSKYSFVGTLPDLVFPPAAGIFAVVSIIVMRARGVGLGRRPFVVAAILPAFAGGCLALALAVIMWVPPFTLAALFFVDEVAHEQVIQRETSPDGHTVAVVMFRAVGAYDGGNGRILVQVRDGRLPLLEREVFVNGRSYATESTRRYVRWEDARTLAIVGEPDTAGEQVSVNWLPW